jgi:trigger factor
VTVNVTFPKDYQAKELKGKAATFDCVVKEVKVPVEAKVDDDFAKSLGLTGLDQLRSMLKDQQQQELNGLTRTHMKRRLLDQLAQDHSFDVPPSMVDAEFEQIMAQLRHEASHEDDADAALKEIEGDSAEYRKIAERRVRLGLLLSEIGTANGIDITQQEMNRLIGQAAAQYRPEDRDQFIRFVQENPMAAAQLRAPLFEDKVVEFLFEKADVTERKATRAEIEADLESEEGHVHGPGCGHDHDHGDAKPKKAAAKGKAKADAKPAKAEDKPAKSEAKKPGAKTDAKPAATKKAPAKKAK